MKNAIYLCKPKGELIASLYVDEETVSLTEQVATPWELTFDIHRYLYKDDFQENPYYDSISEMMELYLFSETVNARFIIDGEPAINSDGTSEVKTVTAHSLEAELQYKFLEDFQINTGQKQSQENLLQGNLLGEPVATTDNSQELYDYNLNPYTNLPIDYITVCCLLGEELKAFRNSVSSSAIVWTFDGEDSETVIPITFNSSTGIISGNSTLISKWYQEFTNKFPRTISDITWGIDKQNSASETYNSVICVTDVYITIDSSGNVIIPSPTHSYKLNSSKTAYEINAVTTTAHSFDYFLNGLNRIINFYDKFSSQLSMLDLILEKAKATDWTIGEVPNEIAKKKYSFTAEYQDIYSFMVNDVSHTMKILFDFESVSKTINVIDLSTNDREYETGIVTGFQNLLQTVDISSASEDGIKTTFLPSGANDLGITYVNFGKNKITNLDYFINKVDKYGEYQYGSASLHDRYKAWKAFRDEDLRTVSIPSYSLNLNTKTILSKTTTLANVTNRELYVELSKAYNQTLKDLSDLTYLVPSDGAMTDYTSYNLEELQTAYTAYINAYNALVEIYKAEYGKTSVVENEIINTYFYQDYILYKNTIIPNILNALKIYALTDSNGNFLTANGNVTTSYDEFYYPDGGNPAYNGNAELVTESKSETFLYDMSLYGLSELESKKKAWLATAAQIFKAAFVKSGTPGLDAVYRTWSQIQAEGLNSGFTDQASYERQLNKYLDYMATTSRTNSLTKSSSKGVVVLATEEIVKCENVISQMESVQTSIGFIRTELTNSVTYEGWGGFTEDELSILYSLSHEAEYQNENILTTNLDDIVTEIDVQQELYEDACKRLFDKSRPQYTIATTLDNILAIDGFSPLRNQLKLLNYFYLKYGLYDDETMKLRIVKITFNPIIKTDNFALEFSNMTYTFEGLDDMYYLFEQNMSRVGSSAISSSSTGSSGTYGTNDAEITLSNNMLNALLKNSTTASSLSMNNLLTTKQVENLLVQGDLIINGAAITNLIKSKNSNGSSSGIIDNTTGSVLNLQNGQFNFGGGKLIYDGTNLTLKDGVFKSPEITSGIIKSSNYNGTNNNINNTTGTILNLNTGYFNFGGGKLTFDGTTLTAKGELVSGAVKSTNYNGSNNGIANTAGSIINLNNGYFNFGGGKLTFNGTTLTMKGELVAGAVKSENYNGTNNGINNTAGSILELTNGYFNFAGGGQAE